MRNARKQRDAQRKNARALVREFGPRSQCGNCGEMLAPGDGHFVTPSLGEAGFYCCQTATKGDRE